MSITLFDSECVREQFRKTELRLKETPLARSLDRLLRLSTSVYEFNRGAQVSALRTNLAAATLDDLRRDILENIRLFLESRFEDTTSQDHAEEMVIASVDIWAFVEAWPIAN